MKKNRLRIFLAIALVLFGVGAAIGVAEKDFIVRSFSPRGTVEGRVQIRAVFNREVVSEDETGRNLSAAEMPFIFTPALVGEGRWADSKTFIFTPAGGRLAPAEQYRAAVNPWLRDLEGRQLSGTKTFSFNTPRLRFIGVTQSGFEFDMRRVHYELEFSLPVSVSRLSGYASLSGSSGGLKFSLKQGSAPNKVILTAGYFAEAKLTILKDFPPGQGTMGLERDVKVTLRPVLSMKILDTNVESGTRASRVVINTSAPVDLARADSFVSVSPAADYTLEPYSRGFSINGNFRPQDRVTVTIKKGLPALTGSALEEEWSRAFIFPDKEPGVEFGARGRVITPAGSLRLPLESVNVDKLSVQVWKLYENNIPLAMRNNWSSFPMDLSRIVFDKSYTVAGKPNETVRRALDLRQAISGDRGVFLVIARNEGREWAESRTTLNVTDLGVTAKAGPVSAFAWVNSIQTGEPIYGAKVTFWSWANQPVAEAVTDVRGCAAAKLGATASERPVLATVSKGADTAYVRLENGLFGGVDEIDTSGQEWLYRGYTAFCYLPRDVFRPGERAPFRALVRDGHNAAPRPFPVTVKFFTPSGKQWGEQTVKLTEEGTFAADVEIPIDAQVGLWRASLFAPGAEAPIGGKEFMVEEFTPPRLFVEASADKTILVGKESAALAISSRYTFGGKAAGLPWEAERTVRIKEFSPEGWKDYRFHDAEADSSFRPESDFIGSGKLDDAGAAAAEIKGGSWPVPSMARIAARAGVMEEGGRWVYETVNLDWYPGPVMIGIGTRDGYGEYKVSDPAEIRVAAVTVEGKAAGVKKLNYKIFRKIRRQAVYESNGSRGFRTQTELLERADGVISLKEGKGTVAFTPSQPGWYLVRVWEAGGAKASSEFYAYSGGYHDGEEAGGTNLPARVELTTDKKEYKTGEVVRVRIKSPFAGQVLLGVETCDMVHRVVRGMGGKEEVEISFRANEFMLPNAWITVQVIRPAGENAKGEVLRAYGAAPLMMDNSGSKLSVGIDEIGAAEPGPLDVGLTVKDARGRPAAAEVTLMLVDETVLELTGWRRPDPWEWFCARRKLGMETYDLYNAIISPEDQTTPQLTPGGGGYNEMAAMEKRSLSPVKTQRFKILTLVRTVKTDGNGKATVRLDLPEFAGAARLTAVAVSARASGSGEAPVGINREIVLEPSLPRALAPKDVLSAPLSVFNMAGRDITAKVSITASGPIKLDGADKFTVTVKAGESVSRELSFRGTGGFGAARVGFEARWEGGVVREELELPVRPPFPRISVSEALVIKPDESARLGLSGDWFPGTRSGRVMLSAMSVISLAEITQYLITYPYGCLEQTVSSAWPVLVMPELAAAVDPALATKQSLEGALQLRLQRIRALQNLGGGFSRWPGSGWSHSWDSIYAAHFLLEAKKREAAVPQETVTQALNYVRGQLSAAPPNDSAWAWRETMTRRAYACYVLALAGEKQLGWMSSLRDNEKDLPPSARLLLAAAYGEAGQKKEAAAMLGQTLEVIKPQPGGNDIYDSNLRNRALLLLAWTHVDPSLPEAASAALNLMNNFKAAGYYTTQEGGFSTLALARYFSAQPGVGKPAGMIKDGSGKTLAELDEKNRIISADVGAQDSFLMVNNGKDRLFCASTVSGVPVKEAAPVDSGIKIRQSIKDRAGREAGNAVTRGEALTSTVEITPTAGSLRNVVVAIPLPAGLEVENPKLTGEDGELPHNARVELRDDRVLLFIDSLSETMKWRCSLRPVTAGKFAVPQISAECMYDPAVRSISGGGTLEIRNAE